MNEISQELSKEQQDRPTILLDPIGLALQALEDLAHAREEFYAVQSEARRQALVRNSPWLL